MRPVDWARLRWEQAKEATADAQRMEEIALSEYAEALADLELGAGNDSA